MDKPYYLAYEERYRKAYAAGAERWGHAPDDETLVAALTPWVRENDLTGRSVIEFACGEGACGVILSGLGCAYHGVDIAPSAVEKAALALKGFPQARVSLLDMVRDAPGETYDAALDCMGFHMLVTDSDRAAYLSHAFDALKSGAPMLFFRESYRDPGAENRETAYEGEVRTYEQWLKITGHDYETPTLRLAPDNGQEVWLPLVPARASTKEGYLREMRSAGFLVERFEEMGTSYAIRCSANLYVRKP